MTKGLLMVFTGDGKGKTTAALGMALRSAGHGHKVCFIQFIKGKRRTGEREAALRFSDTIDFHVTGRGFTWKSKDIEEDKNAALVAWNMAQEAMASGRYHLVVLDEFTYLLAYRMVDLETVLQAFSERPSDLHVAVTGRNAPEGLLSAADLVTEMRAVKHPFSAGVKAQKGIEY